MTVAQTILLALAALLLGEETPETVQLAGIWWGDTGAAAIERLSTLVATFTAS